MKNGLIIDQDGTKRYYLNDQYHRIDGPAIEYTNGSKYWFLHDQLHRVDGPAYEYAGGYKAWYINGKELPVKTQQEFEQYMRLIAFW